MFGGGRRYLVISHTELFFSQLGIKISMTHSRYCLKKKKEPLSSDFLLVQQIPFIS